MPKSNPFAFGKPITLDTLNDLFAHHKALTGGFSMEVPTDPPPADPPKQDDPPKFEAITSQEQLDRILGGRLQREREKFADYDDIKAKAEQFDQLEEASRTEQEKAVEAARKEGETAASVRADARIVASEARALAAEAGARNSGAVVKLLDLSGVKVNEDGTVDEAAIKDRLDELKTSDAYLFGADGKPAPKADPSQGHPRPDTQSSVSKGRDAYRNSRRTAKKDS